MYVYLCVFLWMLSWSSGPFWSFKQRPTQKLENSENKFLKLDLTWIHPSRSFWIGAFQIFPIFSLVLFPNSDWIISSVTSDTSLSYNSICALRASCELRHQHCKTNNNNNNNINFTIEIFLFSPFS